MRYLLDTHVVIQWHAAGRPLSPPHKRIISRARPDEPLWVADITLWEIAVLCERGRIRLDVPLRELLERATAAPLVRVAPITPAIVAEMTSLPATADWDPADRIIVATARALGATLVTADARVADSGVVPTA